MIRALDSGEKRKIHTPVFAVMLKVGMCRKRIASRVFEYENALFIQDIRAKYEVRKLCQALVIKGWICKNNIKRLNWFIQVPENICSDYTYLVQLYVSAGILYEFKVHWCHLNGKHRLCSPGGKFIGDTACA